MSDTKITVDEKINTILTKIEDINQQIREMHISLGKLVMHATTASKAPVKAKNEAPAAQKATEGPVMPVVKTTMNRMTTFKAMVKKSVDEKQRIINRLTELDPSFPNTMATDPNIVAAKNTPKAPEAEASYLWLSLKKYPIAYDEYVKQFDAEKKKLEQSATSGVLTEEPISPKGVRKASQ
jgi:cell division septum initiation protein DivIVA